MTDPTDHDDDSPSAAEREGIVDQQGAAISAIDQAGAANEDTDEDTMEGEAPTG